MNSTFLKTAPLMLAGSLALFGGSAAHAQGFTFTAPTTTFVVTPGQVVSFSGTFQNDNTIEQIDGLTINLGPAPGSYAGKFTFTSPINTGNVDLAVNQTIKFTGSLKISSTATFKPTSFYFDANATGDSSGEPYDFTSNNFTVVLAPAAVPEASSLVSTGILLTLGLGAFALRARKRSATNA